MGVITLYGNTYSKFRPVVAGYSIDRRNFLSGPITNTARHVSGRPSLSFSRGSSIPNCTARSLFSSAIIGYGNPSPKCFA